jgi:hypothetical protein
MESSSNTRAQSTKAMLIISKRIVTALVWKQWLLSSMCRQMAEAYVSLLRSLMLLWCSGNRMSMARLVCPTDFLKLFEIK